MAHNLINNDVYSDPVIVPDNGDVANAGSVEIFAQALTDRTTFLLNRAPLSRYSAESAGTWFAGAGASIETFTFGLAVSPQVSAFCAVTIPVADVVLGEALIVDIVARVSCAGGAAAGAHNFGVAGASAGVPLTFAIGQAYETITDDVASGSNNRQIALRASFPVIAAWVGNPLTVSLGVTNDLSVTELHDPYQITAIRYGA